MDRLCARIARSLGFQRLILGTIVLAIALAGLETEPWIMDQGGGIIRVLDRGILGIFTLEAVIKMVAQGRRPWRYFQDPWNAFDFLILICLLLPFWGNFFVLLRVGRLLRILRVITAFPRLRLLISTLLQSLPSMGYILLILGLLFYVYGVAGTFLFGANDPVYFGSLGVSILSLFTVVTLEGWTTIMYIQIYGCDRYGYEGLEALCTAPEQFPVIAPLFFVSFVLIGAMVILNLFVGVIISSMMSGMDDLLEEEVRELERAAQPAATGNSLRTQIQDVEHKLNRIQSYLQSLNERLADLSGDRFPTPPDSNPSSVPPEQRGN